MKGKEEASQRMLNEIEVSQLSDIGFKAMQDNMRLNNIHISGIQEEEEE